jgi:hypothetical protein
VLRSDRHGILKQPIRPSRQVTSVRGGCFHTLLSIDIQIRSGLQITC